MLDIMFKKRYCLSIIVRLMIGENDACNKNYDNRHLTANSSTRNGGAREKSNP